MSLYSSLADFSLAELLQIIDRGKKTGRLIVCNLLSVRGSAARSRYYFIWFRQGRIVAVSNSLNGEGLSSKIRQRKWVEPQVLDKFRLAEVEIPLGVRLKAAGLLDADHLNLLFASQLKQIREIFEIQKGFFKLDSHAPIPTREMTGLCLRALEVALMSLRTLKNWETLASVLPDANSAICSISQSKPHLHLKDLDWQVWEFANGRVSLKQIADVIDQPIALIQQAAFRLMIAGLVEEVSLVASMPQVDNDPLDINSVNSASLTSDNSSKPELLMISDSFLNNLVGYLNSKI